MSTRILKISIIVGFIITIFSCTNKSTDDFKQSVDTFSPDISLQWYKLFLEVDRFSPGYRPPAAARLLGYVGLAAYESVVDGMSHHKSIASNYSGLIVPPVEANKDYHWPTVLNSLYLHMYKKFYPNVALLYVDRMEALQQRFYSTYGLTVPAAVMQRSKDRGELVANAFYVWSQSDDLGHNGFKNPQPADYTPPKGPGLWQPTAPDFGKALFPYWGRVRPFALTQEEILGNNFTKYVEAFSEDTSSKFYKQAYNVYKLTTPTAAEKQWIGEFWSDDIFEQTFEPAARWISVANQVVDHEKSNLETAVLLYAKLGMSMTDAAIAVWKTKYTYNIERPVTYINRLIDAKWTSTLNNTVNGLKGLTPPFPAYPSGHAGFGAAAAGVLNDVYGKNYGMTDKSHELRTEFNGTPRTFKSFDDMAIENAVSRLYLGVHYQMDADEGLSLGYKAAAKVNSLPWNK